jgi:hypothetical protein
MARHARWPFSRAPLAFAAYDDRRWIRTRVSLALRLTRWAPLIPSTCDHPGCVNVGDAIADDNVAALRLARDPPADGIDLQLVIGATSPAGQPLPDLEVSFAAGANVVTSEIDARYAGAKLELLDVSPFPRSCATPAP